MCVSCGCSHSEEHHHHDHDHTHEPSETEETRSVQLEKRILARNDEIAEKVHAQFQDLNIKTLNLLSSPGAGKTTLLETTLTHLGEQLPFAVIEGDQHTHQDAERIKKTGTPVVQINTGKACHLEAKMIWEALPQLPLPENGVLFIENVGNLICPAEFNLGEELKVVLFSTTEGEDKPIKYPHMFHEADLIVITKTDLLPYLRFDMDRAIEYVKQVNSKAEIIYLNTYEEGDTGFNTWCDWILGLARD